MFNLRFAIHRIGFKTLRGFVPTHSCHPARILNNSRVDKETNRRVHKSPVKVKSPLPLVNHWRPSRTKIRERERHGKSVLKKGNVTWSDCTRCRRLIRIWMRIDQEGCSTIPIDFIGSEARLFHLKDVHHWKRWEDHVKWSERRSEWCFYLALFQRRQIARQERSLLGIGNDRTDIRWCPT